MTKAQREARFAAAVSAAHEAGMAAGVAAAPTPMMVGTPRNMMGSLMGGDGGGFRSDRPTYVVEGGVCGFAYVKMYAARGGESRQLANFLQSDRSPVRFRRGDRWNGTCFMSVFEFGQSLTRKQAYAYAFAAKLRELLPDGGSKVYGESRMD